MEVHRLASRPNVVYDTLIYLYNTMHMRSRNLFNSNRLRLKLATFVSSNRRVQLWLAFLWNLVFLVLHPRPVFMGHLHRD